MKIKDGFVLKSVGGSNMIVPLGSRVADFGAIIKINETGAFLWKLLTNEVEESELVDALVAEYEVDTAKAVNDVSAFLSKLSDADLLV